MTISITILRKKNSPTLWRTTAFRNWRKWTRHSFQVEAVKVKELSRQQYIDAIDFEFNLPLPGGRSYGRNEDVKHALGLTE